MPLDSASNERSGFRRVGGKRQQSMIRQQAVPSFLSMVRAKLEEERYPISPAFLHSPAFPYIPSTFPLHSPTFPLHSPCIPLHSDILIFASKFYIFQFLPSANLEKFPLLCFLKFANCRLKSERAVLRKKRITQHEQPLYMHAIKETLSEYEQR